MTFFFSISSLYLIQIFALALFYLAVLLLFDGFYIQSIGTDIGTISGLLVSSLVPVKPNRLTGAERAQFTISQDLKDILVGLILGDLYINKPGLNARLCFKQGIIHKDYLEHLYELFKNYCSSAPVISNLLPDSRTGKIYTRIYFYSYALPCLNEIYALFYVNGKKVVPLNIALELPACLKQAGKL